MESTGLSLLKSSIIYDVKAQNMPPNKRILCGLPVRRGQLLDTYRKTSLVRFCFSIACYEVLYVAAQHEKRHVGREKIVY
jgi:hypothetical protein